MGKTTATIASRLLLTLGLFLLACKDSQFEGTAVTLDIDAVGNGSGLVTGPTATRLNCVIYEGSSLGCQSTFIDGGAGGIFALEARPDSISRFVKWGGSCSGLTCVVSFESGRDTTIRVSAHFILIAPAVTITAPANSATFTANQDIDFRAVAQDARGKPLSPNPHVWTSNIDGPLCATAPANSCASFRRTLSTGQHVITVTVADNDGTPASASVPIAVRDSVNEPPVAQITTPQNGFAFPSDQPFRFAGSGRDPEEGFLPDSVLEWSSNRDGRLGFGSNLSKLLSVGNHRITLRVTDSKGASGTASVDVTATSTCASQPMAWYRLDGNGGDASGNGNQGTIQGATPIANRHGEAGKALSFDGSDDSVELGDSFNTLTLPFTIAVWVYRPSSAGEALRSLLVTDDEPGRYAGIWFQTEALGHPSITFADGNGAGAAFRRTFTTSNPIPPNTWVHVAATVRGAADMTIYVNGAAVPGVYSGTGGPLVHTPGPARIGRITILPTNRPWLGGLDELRIYNCSLDSAEVAALHALH